LYRKFTANNIFTGYQMMPAGHCLITKLDGTIVEITEVENAGDNIENFVGVLTPGFVNAHCHLELSHLKGIIPQHAGLIDFIFKIITERNASDEKIQNAITEADATMLQNGIVAVGDICNTHYTIARKKQSKIKYHNFIELSGFAPAAAQQKFDAGIQVQKQFTAPASITPHASYSVSPSLFELINDYANNHLLSLHNQETPAEDEFFKTATGDFLKLYQQLNIDISFYKPSGKSSLQTVLPHLNKQQQLLLVHDVTTTQNDIEFIQNMVAKQQLSSVYFCLCPNANLYITNTLPNVDLLVKNTENIVLGTDSLASNKQLCIFEEIKTLQHHFPKLSLVKLLQWATINGAKALQMQNSLGSFEKDKKPGVVLINAVTYNGEAPLHSVTKIL
jgi:aminodeoxyfutalosine deaminase